MPKDQREARFYYQSKLHEIADTYILFSIAKWIGFVGVLQRNFESINIIGIFAMSTLILVAIRIAFYYFRDRSLRLFGYHLAILYGLDIVFFAIQQNIRISQLDDEEESNVKIDQLNRTLEVVWVLHTFFTTPTFRICLIQCLMTFTAVMIIAALEKPKEDLAVYFISTGF